MNLSARNPKPQSNNGSTRSYNMKQVPNPILINTGDQEKSGIQNIIDTFFLEIAEEWINENPSIKKENLQIKVGNHSYLGNSNDNNTTYLSYGEGKPLAVVMETRTEFNRINYTFFKNI